jgi:ABC-type transporter Mla subunit MlaD
VQTEDGLTRLGEVLRGVGGAGRPEQVRSGAMTNTRNNVIAGVFVLMGLVLAVWASFMLSDRSGFPSTRDFSVRFTLAQGAMGLKRGSPVLLAGQPIGRVLGVEFDTPAGDGVPGAVDVLVEVRSDLTLYENAVINLEKPLLGSLSSINITAVGSPEVPSPQGRGPQIEADETVPGRLAPPGFLADAGLGPEQSEQIRSAIASIDAGIRRISDLIERSGPQVEAGIGDARQVLADLRQSVGEWRTKIDATLGNVESASGRLEPIMTGIESGVEEARVVIASVRSLIDDNRARLDRTIASLESAAGKIDSQTIESVNAALRDGRDALGTFSEAVATVSRVVGEEAPSLRRTLANLRVMSDQLKLTAVEVRSQPWRLLHQPTAKEFEAQVLYDATRSYAEAVSDLRAASESVESASASRPEGDADLRAVLGTLSAALERYRQAEQYLFDKLAEKEK